MRFSTATLLSTLLAGTAVAVPSAEAENVKSMAYGETWTIRHMRRECDHHDNCCTWSFAIDTGHGHPTDCWFEVYAQGGKPASRSPAAPGCHCGGYTVTSGWSGQFGEGNGFTTLSVVDDRRRLIAWPAYTDKQLWGGHVVRPDQCYPVQSLP